MIEHYYKMVQVVESKTQLIRWWSILLLRQHVSALALGHHQVSNCVLKGTIQCSIYITHNIQRDLVDGVTIDNFQGSYYIKQDHKLYQGYTNE
jgi:hypothetical protein